METPDLVCFECKNEFEKLTLNKDENSRCKKCSNAWRNREYRKRSGKEVYARNREKIIARVTKWNKSNPEKRKTICRNYDKVHRKERSDYSREYQRTRYQSDPEYRNWRNIHASKHIRAYIDDCLAVQPECQICGSQEDLTVDHMVPIFKGGKAERSNVQTLCRGCNSFKRDKIFLADNQGFLVEE